MTLIFQNGVLLFRNGLLAKDPRCCCDTSGCCCPNITGASHPTLYAHVDGGSVHECVAIVANPSPICGSWAGTIPDLVACTAPLIPMRIIFYCSVLSQGCNGYRLLAGYNNSSCQDVATVRSPASCVCDPFSIAFTVPAPSNRTVPPVTGCECTEAGGTLTVTINTTPC
jgi:hypothetical protein